MWGDSLINTAEKMNGHVKSRPRTAISNIRDVLAAWKYHVDNDIANILTRQRNRVGQKFAAIERVLDGYSYNSYAPYKSIDLQDKWNAWTSGRVVRAKQRAEAYMTTWLEKLKDEYATKAKREEAATAAADGQDEKQKLIQTIDLLEAAIDAKPTWDMPF
jgi:hypothetical protein